MGKRPADRKDEEQGPLKDGDKPMSGQDGGDEIGQFEDDFEDEYESEDEDEIMEAGADGRPDEEVEAEEAGGT